MQQLARALSAARRLGIDVTTDGRRNASGSSSPWFADMQTIHVNTRGAQDIVVAILAHEVGHCLSVRRGSLTTLHDYMIAKWTRRYSPDVVAEEARAWRLGFAWLKREGFTVTPRMRLAAKLRLATFKVAA